ncbi:hypothetical protein TRVL_07044 [Trypanosoma vivax]|nr:hypothetical protein TRVL_07044 [Trypanosoma vivax]
MSACVQVGGGGGGIGKFQIQHSEGLGNVCGNFIVPKAPARLHAPSPATATTHTHHTGSGAMCAPGLPTRELLDRADARCGRQRVREKRWPKPENHQFLHPITHTPRTTSTRHGPPAQWVA